MIEKVGAMPIQELVIITGNPIMTKTQVSDIAVASLKGATTVTKPDPDADISPTNIATITGIANPTITASSGAASNSQTISGELYSLPNGTADEYDGQAAKRTKRIGKMVFDGTEVWTGYQMYYYAPVFNAKNNASNIYQTHFKYGSLTLEGNAFINNNLYYCVNYDGGAGGVDTFKAYLAAQAAAGTPVTVYYELAAPEITEAAYDLTCYDGNTTFSAPSVPAENLSVTLLDGRTVGNAARLGGQPPYVYQQSNPNLLDNWDFRPGCIVNQRGQNSYTGIAYGMDRWRISTTSGSIEITEQGLTLSAVGSGSTIYQSIPNLSLYRGKTLTFSVEAGGEIYSNSYQIPQEGPFDSPNALFSGGCYIDIYATQPLVKVDKFWFRFLINSDVSVNAVTRAKLELGPVSTLHLDPPADYGTELAKCQRYLLPISIFTYFPGGINHEKKVYCSIPTPVTMQSLPTLTNTALSDYQIIVNGTYYNPATITIFNMSASTVNVYFTFSDDVLDEIPILTPIIVVYTNPNEPCYLSAEL